MSFVLFLIYTIIKSTVWLSTETQKEDHVPAHLLSLQKQFRQDVHLEKSPCRFKTVNNEVRVFLECYSTFLKHISRLKNLCSSLSHCFIVANFSICSIHLEEKPTSRVCRKKHISKTSPSRGGFTVILQNNSIKYGGCFGEFNLQQISPKKQKLENIDTLGIK